MVIYTSAALAGFSGTRRDSRPTRPSIMAITSPSYMGMCRRTILREACFEELSVGQLPKYEQAGTWPPGYQCNTLPTNQCYQFRSTYSSPLNLNKSDPPFGSPDSWVEFKPISYNADRSLYCFDNNCVPTHTQPSAVTETQYDFNAVLRRTIMHEMGHAFLLATTADHCGGDACVLGDGVKDWTLLPFGTACGHKAQIQGAVHNSRH